MLHLTPVPHGPEDPRGCNSRSRLTDDRIQNSSLFFKLIKNNVHTSTWLTKRAHACKEIIERERESLVQSFIRYHLICLCIYGRTNHTRRKLLLNLWADQSVFHSLVRPYHIIIKLWRSFAIAHQKKDTLIMGEGREMYIGNKVKVYKDA